MREFIDNPTEISKHIIDINKKLSKKYQPQKGIVAGVKLRLNYLQKWEEIYDYCNNFLIEKSSVIGLFTQYKKIADYIAQNNTLLAYAFLKNKNKKINVLTKEDEKLLFLKKFANNQISKQEFNKKFGHYALNAFELSSKRFSEYTNGELKKIANLCKDIKINKIKKLNPKENLFETYCYLREELKYNSLLIISKIRFKLLNIQKNKQINNIFNLSYNKLIKATK